MNNLNTRIILINQYFRLFFKCYTPPISISILYIHQFHPFIRSSVHPFIRSSVHPFIHSSIHPFIHSSIHSRLAIAGDLYIPVVYTRSGESCVFPFTAFGKTYHHCTTDHIANKVSWCSLSFDWDKDRKMGWCNFNKRR